MGKDLGNIIVNYVMSDTYYIDRLDSEPFPRFTKYNQLCINVITKHFRDHISCENEHFPSFFNWVLFLLIR